MRDTPERTIEAVTADTLRPYDGPTAAGGVDRSTLTGPVVPPDLGEWAKGQTEGLSGLLEKLLAEEHARRANPRALEDAARLTAVVSDKRLAKIWDTPEEDAAWAHL